MFNGCCSVSVGGCGLSLCLRGFDVLAYIVQVTFDSGCGFGWVFPQGFDGEAWKWGQESFLEGSQEGGISWGK